MMSLEYARSLLLEAYGLTADPDAVLILYPLRGVPNQADIPGQIIPIDHDLIRIGRQSCCWIQLKDQFLSRLHGTLYRLQRGGRWIYRLQDGDGGGQSSSNGIFVNGSRLQATHELQDRDWIQLGNQVFVSFHRVRIPTLQDQHHQISLCKLLLKSGWLTPEKLDIAQGEARYQGQMLGEFLVTTGQISAQTLAFFEQIHLIQVPIPVGKHPVGEYLKAAGLATEQQILEALQLQKRSQTYFGHTLVQWGCFPKPVLDLFIQRYGHLHPARESTISLATLGNR